MDSPPKTKGKKRATSNLAKILFALRFGRGAVRIMAGLASLFSVIGLTWSFTTILFHLSSIQTKAAAFTLGVGGALVLVTTTLQRVEEQNRFKFRVEAAEKNLIAHPDRPRLAWELAQVKLESYLNRNLAQVKSIFFLTVIVMLVGFSLIGIGSYCAIHDEQKFKASALSAVSGVIFSFIGGTFLVLYKATMEQAKDYVTILERINAVGMSVQILESLGGHPELKSEAMAEVAKQLLHMYSTSEPRPARTSRRRSATAAKDS